MTLILHVRNMEDAALAKRKYNKQLAYGWPGLVKEGVKLCEQLGIPDFTKIKASEIEVRDPGSQDPNILQLCWPCAMKHKY